MSLRYEVINSNNEHFLDYCALCEEEVVKPNSIKQGGSLNYHNLTYQADLLMVCFDQNIIVGFIAMEFTSLGLYLCLGAVKPNYQRLGIGDKMVKIVKRIAKNQHYYLSAHVDVNNQASLNLLRKNGFEIKDNYSTKKTYLLVNHHYSKY